MKTKLFFGMACLISVTAFAKDGRGTISLQSMKDPLTVKIEMLDSVYSANQSVILSIPDLFQSDDRQISEKISQGKMMWDKENRKQSRELAAFDVRKVLQEIANCYASRGPSSATSVECYGPAAQVVMKEFQYLDASDAVRAQDGELLYHWTRAVSGDKGGVTGTRNSKELTSIRFEHTVLEAIKIGAVSCAHVGSTESSKSYALADQYPYFCTIGILN